MIRSVALHSVAAMPQYLPHIARGLRLAALVATVALVAAPAAFATYPGKHGRIAFYSVTESGPQIFSVRQNGQDLRQLTHVTTGEAKSPDWSPDGRMIAFAIESDETANVAIMNADGSGMHVLPHPAGVFDSDPTFTPDGRRLIIDR